MVGDEALARQKPLGVPEVAKELSYSERSIREMLNRGDIKATRLRPGGKWLITREDLDNYKADRGLEPALVRTESDTRIEGQLFKQDPLVAEARRKRDERIFKDSDAIMSERDLLGLRVGEGVLEGRSSSIHSQSPKLLNFIYHFMPQSNKYLSRELYDLTETLCNSLEALVKFATDDLYYDSSPTLIRLYPDFYPVERNTLDEKRAEQYRMYVDELRKLEASAREAYKAYRIAVREILFL
jgi:excisionase family DNA binding protein